MFPLKQQTNVFRYLENFPMQMNPVYVFLIFYFFIKLFYRYKKGVAAVNKAERWASSP